MARLVDHSDLGVRKGALQVLGQIYFIIEEDIWKKVGQVSPKARDLMENMFKQVKILKSPQTVSSPRKSVSSPRKSISTPRKSFQSSTSKKIEQSEPPQKSEQASPQTAELSSGQQR